MILFQHGKELFRSSIGMFRLFVVLIVGSVLSGISASSALARVINCERTSNDTTGWNSREAFESVWPREFSLPQKEFIEAGVGSKAMLWVKDYGGGWVLTIRLLPNKKALGSFKSTARDVVQPAIVRYQCDTSSNELRNFLASDGAANNDSTNSTSGVEKGCFDGNVSVCTSEQLCNRATSRRDGIKQWDTLKKFQPYVVAAKSRGLSCGVTDNNPTSNTTSSSKLNKAKSTCTEIGFTAGTEDYGKCVLKMMDN